MDELLPERASRYFAGRHEQKIVCRSRRDGAWPVWFFPDGTLVPQSAFPSYPTDVKMQSPFYQFFSPSSSQLFVRAYDYIFGRSNVHRVGLYRCGIRGNDITLAVGFYFRYLDDREEHRHNPFSFRHFYVLDPECKMLN